LESLISVGLAHDIVNLPSMRLKVFECICWHCNWNFTIMFSFVTFLPCAPMKTLAFHYPRTHLLFTTHNDYLPNMLYHYTPFSHSHWFVSTFIQSVKKLHINPYFSHLYIIPHSTFHVVIGWTKHSRAQVQYYYNR
jgi:hypothetical protein